MPESPLTSISRLRQVLRIVAAAPRAGLAGGLLLICCAFMLLFQGFGVGLGTRSLDTSSDTNINSLPPQPVLTILIDEYTYRILVPADPEPVYRECSLPEVLSLAEKTTGDVNDIRIRILRRETARQSAETALLESLAATGIGVDAILMPSTTEP